MLSIILNIIKNLFSLIWSNKQWAISILFGIFIIFLILSNRSKDEQINHLTHDTQALSDAKKNLEEEMSGLSLKISFKNKNYDILVRGKSGEIAHKSGYIPDEGNITFKEFKLITGPFKNSNSQDTSVTAGSIIENKVVAKIIDNATPSFWKKMKRWLEESFIGPIYDGDNSQVIIQDRGFTFKPGLGIFYDRSQKYGVNLGLDVKLLYYKRLSMGLGASMDNSYIWGSTHLDKLSFGLVNNFELMMGVGTPYDDFLSRGNFIIGLRSNW